MRLLDRDEIPYRVSICDDVHDESWSSVQTAKTLNVLPEVIYKTLVLRSESDAKELIVCCIPCDQELDLKKAAKASGIKKLEMIHVKEMKEITGYVRGGCSPIGMKKKFPTYIDEMSTLLDEIYLSGGAVNTMVVVDPNRIIEYLSAQPVDLVKDPISR